MCGTAVREQQAEQITEAVGQGDLPLPANLVHVVLQVSHIPRYFSPKHLTHLPEIGDSLHANI